MANNDLDEVKFHATQTFEAVGRSFNKIGRGKRALIILAGGLFFFIGGYVTCKLMNDIPALGTIEKIAAQPDLPNKCKYRYDRAMEYAIMHECVFAGQKAPRNQTELVQRINYCTCALEGVQKKKPYQKMFENNLVDFSFKIREENLCQENKVIPTLEEEEPVKEKK
ncbi:hypothetical protein [Fibrobacter sp. UWEL]|uniref:hypothetical protein n=1 Tax=Fibrobacter sp. UWEL TaxID=1896209 RepID=UPI00091348CE|nr:hypothetical protein [Fibrobacter sp. UWEL]SHK62392.1 hypothetical protein SAMN05720468_10486 [Fibrobacter sp. UWEL]